MTKPTKPYADFPLFPSGNGQWARKVYAPAYPKGKLFYFGLWRDDPKGEKALVAWKQREAGILTGLDSIRVKGQVEGLTISQLKLAFLEAKALAVSAEDLSPLTLKDYVYELGLFVHWGGEEGQVVGLSPAHFSRYAKHLIEARKLGRHARRRVVAYVKAMFNWGAENGKHPALQYGSEFTAPDTSPDAMRQAKARAGQKDHSKRIVTGPELDRMLALAQPNFVAMILLGVNCGLGPADLGRLRWSHLDLHTGELNMPRGKTGTERVGYLWNKTRAALKRVAKLKHTKRLLEKEGQSALVFVTRKGLPVYRESESKGQVQVANAISGTFSKLAKRLDLEGVTFYRLRHTFKTLGKRAKDSEALNLMMGHKDRSTGKTYDHEEIDRSRIKRVAVKVKHRLWTAGPAKITKASLRLVA